MKFKDYLQEYVTNQINELEDKESYKKYFEKILKKYGVESPDELSDSERKKFFDEVDAGWKAEKESD